MMKFVLNIFLCLMMAISCTAQNGMTVGKDKLPVGYVTHQYIYELTYKDSARLSLIDSVLILATKDSLFVEERNSPSGSGNVLVTDTWLNKQKKVLTTEESKNNVVNMTKEWSYDATGMTAVSYSENNREKGAVHREVYSKSTDRINGDVIIDITSYAGDKVEFYSKAYYDKSNRKYKEVRLNDNKKDVLHTENYTYNEAGKLVSRSVYFKEFNVTKTYKEPEAIESPKCYKNFPLQLPDRMGYANRLVLLKSFLQKNQATLQDKDCPEFEYNYKSFNCELQVKTNKAATMRLLRVTVRERN
jgi:hypothetical protein